MTSHYFSEVIKDLEKALENSDDYDVIIVVEEGQELLAHSFMLRARCSYFKRALSSAWEEVDDDGNFVFKKPNVSLEVFQLILRYIIFFYFFFKSNNLAYLSNFFFLDICIRE